MATATGVDLIPREVLLGNPSKVSPRISPDGKKLAYLAPWEGAMNIWLGEIGDDNFEPITFERRPIGGSRQPVFFWAHDNRHMLYLQDNDGDENWRLIAVDSKSLASRTLTPLEGVHAQVVAAEKRFPDRILIALNQRDAKLHDVYELHLSSGEMELICENPGFVGWMADAELVVRAAMRPRPDGSVDAVVRDGPESDWRTLVTIEPSDQRMTNPIAFTLDGAALFMRSSRGANSSRLLRIDLATGAEEVIAEDPEYDVQGVRIHPDTREVQLVTFLKDRTHYQVVDPTIKEEFEAIRSVDDGDVVIIGQDHADETWVLLFNSDDNPARYYLWNRSTRTPTFLFDSRPELKQFTLAKTEPFSFTARDGLTVHGYATFPVGSEGRNLPTVLAVHGGPWARDVWAFLPIVQFLANRGYLCVQVNYRGSISYGKRFFNAATREFAGRMHDDLVDAVEFIIGKGWADPSRIAIYGGSYGGYAALVGATFTPDMFRCAVDICGPSNLITLIRSFPPYWKPMIHFWHQQVGDPETEQELLWSRSPLSRVDQIKIPVLVVQTTNDPRVTQQEAEQIVAAMKEKGIPHEYLLIEGEGHGFGAPENRIEVNSAVERFLAEHLGGRSQDVYRR